LTKIIGISQSFSAFDFLWIQRYGMGTIAMGWCCRFALFGSKPGG